MLVVRGLGVQTYFRHGDSAPGSLDEFSVVVQKPIDILELQGRYSCTSPGGSGISLAQNYSPVLGRFILKMALGVELRKEKLS